MSNYFVVLKHQKPHVKVALTDEYDSLRLFDTVPEAVNAAEGTGLGEMFGFEIFELGAGEFDA